jgi:hypothetical protein
MLRRLRPYIPDVVVSALSNCGGTNRSTSRFAGRLLDEDLTERQLGAICHSLIFGNGVRKTTELGRCASLVASELERGSLRTKREMSVLDIGASAGLDALVTRELLASRCAIKEYVLGDLHTHVLLDQERGLVFDEDHRLLQVRRRFSFVATNFSYNYRFQRLTNLPKRVRPWLLARSHRFDASRPVVRVPLVDRRVSGDDFRLRRMDVFAPIEAKFDLIICMHLLVPRYFGPRAIEDGIANLSRALDVGGTLLVGAADRYRVVQRTGPATFRSMERP